jgi:hypothetical protein
VARKTTRGAWFASNASCHRGAHKHQRSPGLRPGKPSSGTGVERSLPRDFENRETRLSSRRRPCDCQHLLARYCSSRPDESRSWAASSRFRAARQARYVRSTGDQLHYPTCPATLSFPAPQAFKALRKLHLASEGRPRREMILVSALTKSRNWNTQYTGGPLSTLRRSLPLCLLRLSLFGHVIIEPSPEYNQQTKGAI